MQQFQENQFSSSPSSRGGLIKSSRICRETLYLMREPYIKPPRLCSTPHLFMGIRVISEFNGISKRVPNTGVLFWQSSFCTGSEYVAFYITTLAHYIFVLTDTQRTNNFQACFNTLYQTKHDAFRRGHMCNCLRHSDLRIGPGCHYSGMLQQKGRE